MFLNLIMSFNLIVQDLTPQFTLSGDMEICPNESTTITVVPTSSNFDVNAVTFEWTYNGVLIAGATTSTLIIQGQSGYGTYTVTVDNSGCTTTQTFDIVPSTTQWDITFNGTASLCPQESGTLTAVVTNNTNGSPVTYTFTAPNGTQVVSASNTLNISATGVYTVEVDILGCTTTQTFEVIPSNTQWNVTFNGTATL